MVKNYYSKICHVPNSNPNYRVSSTDVNSQNPNFVPHVKTDRIFESDQNDTEIEKKIITSFSKFDIFRTIFL